MEKRVGEVEVKYQIIATAQKPTSVYASVEGNFVEENERSLILAKCNRLETYKVKKEGLEQIGEHILHGRISALKKIRLEGQKRDKIVVVSEKKQFAIWGWSLSMRRLVVEFAGDFEGRIQRPIEEGAKIAVDPRGRCIAAMLFQGTIIIIHTSTGEEEAEYERRKQASMMKGEGKEKEKGGQEKGKSGQRDKGEVGRWPYMVEEVEENKLRKRHLYQAESCRIEELKVLDIDFRNKEKEIEMVLLYEDANMMQHLKVYGVTSERVRFGGGGSISKRTRLHSRWQHRNLDMNANAIKVSSLSTGGIMVLSEDMVKYIEEKREVSKKIEGSVVAAATWIEEREEENRKYSKQNEKVSVNRDMERLLVGDEVGTMFVVIVRQENGQRKIEVERLGEIPVPMTISYVGRGKVFVGSHYGDSQLVKMRRDMIKSNGDEGDTYLEVKETMTNLAPIVDICMVKNREIEGGGQRLITCSGARSRPSLRVIRNGTGIKEWGRVEMKGLVSIWAIGRKRETVLGLSFANYTRFLRMKREQTVVIEDWNVGKQEWLQTDKPSLYIGQTRAGEIVQITDEAVNVYYDDGDVVKRVGEWKSNEGRDKIVVGQMTENQVVVNTQKGELVYLEVENKKVVMRQRRTLDGAEVSSIKVCKANVGLACVVVGLWTSPGVAVYELPSLKQVVSGTSGLAGIRGVGETVTVRSVEVVRLGKTSYLLIGMSDGQLVYGELRVNGGGGVEVVDERVESFGEFPLTVIGFVAANKKQGVLVAGDRPAVMYERSGRPLFSQVNAGRMVAGVHVCMSATSDWMLFYDGCELTIGELEGIQRLHVDTIPLGAWESPQKISHASSQGILAVCTVSLVAGVHENVNEDADEPVEVGSIKIYDDNHFNLITQLDYPKRELPESVCCAFLGNNETGEHLIAVGTVINNDSDYPRAGFIHLYRYSSKNLVELCRRPTRGAVYSLLPYKAMLAATINNRLTLLAWQPDSSTLEVLCDEPVNIVALNLAVLPSAQAQRQASANLNGMGKRGDGEDVLDSITSKPINIADPADSVLAVGDLMNGVSVFQQKTLLTYNPLLSNSQSQNQSQNQNQNQNNKSNVSTVYKFDELCREYYSNWTTALSCVQNFDYYASTSPSILLKKPFANGIRYMVAENGLNLYSLYYGSSPFLNTFTPSKHSNSTSNSTSNSNSNSTSNSHYRLENSSLVTTGRYHLGDLVNSIIPASLTSFRNRHSPSSTTTSIFVNPEFVLGTISGSILVSATIESSKIGRVLDKLQNNMAFLGPTSVCGYSTFVCSQGQQDLHPLDTNQLASTTSAYFANAWNHRKFRSFLNLQKSSKSFAFIDGDLILKFLDLPRDIQYQLFKPSLIFSPATNYTHNFNYTHIGNPAVPPLGHPSVIGANTSLKNVEDLIKSHCINTGDDFISGATSSVNNSASVDLMNSNYLSSFICNSNYNATQSPSGTESVAPAMSSDSQPLNHINDYYNSLSFDTSQGSTLVNEKNISSSISDGDGDGVRGDIESNGVLKDTNKSKNTKPNIIINGNVLYDIQESENVSFDMLIEVLESISRIFF